MVVSIPICEKSSEPFPDLFGRFGRLHLRSAMRSTGHAVIDGHAVNHVRPCGQPFGDSFDSMVHALDGLNHSLDRLVHSLDRMIHSTAFLDSFKTPSPPSFTPRSEISVEIPDWLQPYLQPQHRGGQLELQPPMSKEVDGIERAEDELPRRP